MSLIVKMIFDRSIIRFSSSKKNISRFFPAFFLSFLPSLSFSFFHFFFQSSSSFWKYSLWLMSDSVEKCACLQTKAHIWSLGPKLWKKETDSWEQFSDLHTLTPWCVSTHAPATQTGIVFSCSQSFLLFLKGLLLRKYVLVETVLRRLPFLGWS